MDYKIHKFTLSESQLKKLKKALDDNKPYTLSINKDNLHGEHPLPITENEEKNINASVEDESHEGRIKI